ncbi:hypothetical protein D9619_003623 [Psilocybe cf. subviscida]|uniref:Protein kinase domain-containing protein n=1 Tax=Psilocybe cf. subviscida TaxID=2480587 RepID=A0A8H5ETY8_9AGAR|nr:hypothetical protein D9619_003623 [Psilocybe cf. subviscida]
MAMRVSCDFSGTMSDVRALQRIYSLLLTHLFIHLPTTSFTHCSTDLHFPLKPIQTFHTSPASPLTPSTTGILDTPSTPTQIQTPLLNLDVGEIEGKPFSRNFDDLLEGLGLSHPSIAEAEQGGKCGITIHELPDIDDMMASPDWLQRCAPVDFGSTTKRPGALSVIHEELGESPVMTVPTACLADFEFDFDAFDPPCCNGVNDNRNVNSATTDLAEGSEPEQFRILDGTNNSGDADLFDHLANGNLVDLLNTNGPLASHQTIFYASELLSALSYLHSNGIVHRNVEPRTVLINNDGHIVLTDFSYAGYLSQATTTNHRVVDFSRAEKASVAYHAPELLLGWAHDAAVDCWSFGAVFYFLLFGHNPFENQDGSTTHTGIYERILRSPISVDSMRLVHPMARDLILKCLDRNPSIRWNMDQVKGHPYFSSTDWDQVSSMRLEGTSQLVKSPPPPVKPSVFQSPYSANLNPTVRDSERHLPLGFNLDIYSRQDIAKESMRRDSLQDITKAVERCKPLPRLLDIVQEDEPLSLNLTGRMANAEDVDEHGPNGIDVVPRQPPEDALTKSERMSRFWDEIDREERCAGSVAPSLNSMEFGSAAPGVSYTKAPKLRKHHSAMQTRNRLFNISTSSLHNILRWRARSSTTLRETPPATQSRNQSHDSQHDLPIGVHHMGSGIGFTYNVPAAVPSKLSMCSFVPPCHVFSKRLSTSFHRTGNVGILASSNSNDMAKSGQQNVRQHIEFSLPSCDTEPPVIEARHNTTVAATPITTPAKPDTAPHSKHAGNGTFIRDMYRSPGWIVAPPENVPSPMPLVNSRSNISSARRHDRRASMYVPAEPLSPATLVNGASTTNTSDPDDGDNNCHINIVIPKNLEFEFDIPHQWARGSTLRLVPQPTNSDQCDQSYDDSADISMCTMAARSAL